MNTLRTVTANTLIFAVLPGLSACSGMSRHDKNTVTGAAIGGVAGAVLTGGSSVGTVDAVAVGGIIGHEVDKASE